jgi:hypothetical protein
MIVGFYLLGLCNVFNFALSEGVDVLNILGILEFREVKDFLKRQLVFLLMILTDILRLGPAFFGSLKTPLFDCELMLGCESISLDKVTIVG